jgi:hypothetical protein
MPRSVESNDSGWPTGPDKKGWRHFGDGYAGELHAARIQGYDSSTLGYVDVAVDSDGNLKLAAEVSVTIGTVAQGAAGTSAWKVADVALTDGTQRVGGTVAVSGPLTDTQLRATAVSADVSDRAARLLGHVTIDNATLAITASSLPLPTGAASDATLTGGSLQAQGNVAAGSADSGNPLKVGGKYNAAMPTLTDGQRGDLQLGSRGALKVELTGYDSSGGIPTPTLADALANSAGLAVHNMATLFNGTTWDRWRGDLTNGAYVQVKSTLLASGWVTATAQSQELAKDEIAGAIILLPNTAISIQSVVGAQSIIASVTWEEITI